SARACNCRFFCWQLKLGLGFHTAARPLARSDYARIQSLFRSKKRSRSEARLSSLGFLPRSCCANATPLATAKSAPARKKGPERVAPALAGSFAGGTS